MIKAVIFDMDGVLIEAKNWHYEALNRALKLFGFEITHDDHVTTYDGLPTSRKLEMLSNEYDLPRELHPFIEEMKQAYTMEIIHTECKPRFIHEYALSKLKESGYKLALASNSIRKTVEMMMFYSCLDQYLEIALSNEDVKRAKPYPDIYLKAIDLLGLKAHECVIVEDNEKGIQAAIAAKAHVLKVKEVTDVTLQNIQLFIDDINAKNEMIV